MSSFGEGEEVFFDTADSLVVEESLVKGDWNCGNLDYDIWMKEPQSVNERRDSFLCTMGFDDCLISAKSDAMGSERINESSCEESLLSERRKSNSQANCSVDYFDRDWLDDISIDAEEANSNVNLVADEPCKMEQFQACLGDKGSKKKAMKWWRQFAWRMKKSRGTNVLKESKTGILSRIRVQQSRKRCLECSAVYAGQELKAHNGLIWTMKFSPDGQYLATGGEDGVVCIWSVSMMDGSDGSCKTSGCAFGSSDSDCQMKKSGHLSIVIPEKIFHIEEEPLQKLYGHSSDVLDLAWSTSNYLLSSSTDKTVRLWHAGSNECLGVFRHSNYVTCVQFNPVDENCFISGCIDGKVRIWGILSRRVEDWANVQEIVTAVCYQPNGKGFIVGSVSGTCYFYGSSGDDELILDAEINIHGRKKSSGYRITGIQFLKNDSRRVMVTSEDSKIRILDGLEVVRKYKGLPKSGSQMSASFTASGRHIVSAGDDSRIYLWNHDDICIQASKQVNSIRSCEHFFSEGVTVTLPWLGSDIGQNDPTCSSPPSTSPRHSCQESSLRLRDLDRFSLASWFSMDGSTRASTTWPEEKLPQWDSPSCEDKCRPPTVCGDHLHQQEQKINHNGSTIASKTWGLVFVTAHHDGTIKTFHNYGLPVRV